MVFIIIPVFNRIKFTEECIKSLLKQSFVDYKIILIDHGSTDNTTEYVTLNFPEVIILKGDDSMWWTAATNLGVKYALKNGAEYILTLNNDLVVAEDYLISTYTASLAFDKTLVGSISINIENKEQIVFAGTRWNPWIAKYKQSVPFNQPYSIFKTKYSIINTDLLPGRGTLIPIKAFKELGMFDEINFPQYMADEDFSLRCKNAGYKLIVSSKSAVYSNIAATGLKNVYKKKTLNYWWDFLTSIRSANNIRTRWLWAKKHGKIGLLYFIFDYGRIIASQIRKPYQ